MVLEVYDLECLSNVFTYTGYRPKEDKWFQFIITHWKNQYNELYNHLTKDKIYQIGFNNEAYDYPLLHHLLNHHDEYINLTGLELSQKTYEKSQEIINMEFSTIADKNKFIPQLDLFKVWHFNNKARLTSLKDLEICMKMENIEEMPIHHSTWCKEGDENCILEYNKNDVLATYKFLLVTLGKTEYPLYKGKNKIELRHQLNNKFNVNVTNMGDVPMGYELLLNLYSRESGIDKFTLKQMKTRREVIHLKDCIPSWCKIESNDFKKFLDFIKKTDVIVGSKNDISFSLLTHNYRFDFGLGGSHGACEPGIYESNDDWIIADYDVGSLYPSIAKSLGLYPEHLGPKFNEIYSKFINQRLAEKHKPKNERDNVLIEGFKLILNGTYGKSNEESSFIYDPLYTYRTTIAGQLFICMWSERWIKAVPEIKFLQTNTDGQSIMIPRAKLNLIREVNEQLTKETGLTIEEVFYKKMITRDVNNYIGVYDDYTSENNHVKLKGDFEIDKEFHKDPSMRIVPLAVKNYFVDRIPITETILNNKDIFNFCLRLKTNAKCTPYFTYLKNGQIIKDKLDRTTRYYVSNNGGILQKEFDDGRVIGVNIGYNATLFNKYIKKDIKDYNLNYNFYITQANKLKLSVYDEQLSLF